MKQVKCKSGLTGWQCRLQKSYEDFEDFKHWSDTYDIANRLGFKSAKEAWDANPIIQASTNPSDLCVVAEKKKSPFLPLREGITHLQYHRKPTAGEIKFGCGATHYRDFPVKECLNADGSTKKRIKAKDDGLIYTR